MTGSLIIDARHRLRWHQRLVSDASTTMMWGAWLKLWGPLLSSFAWIVHVGGRAATVNPVVPGAPAGTLEHYALALAGTSGTLLMWKGLPANTVCAPETLSVRDYARHFELPEDAILEGRRASVCVVHHDDAGRIVRVEVRTASELDRQLERIELGTAAAA